MREDALGKVLIIVPTYNEAENLPITIQKIFAAVPDCDLLVVDDGSPDGTGQIAELIAATDPRIHVLHRADKSGLGAAYIAGFGWALDSGYAQIVEMDADGSHPAESLPAMIASMTGEHVGLTIGSRWAPGGSVVDWPKQREALSRAANFYARVALGIRVRDSTAGFRVYQSEVLRGIDFSEVDSKGYCFQIDLTLRTLAAGYRIVEVPIVFEERQFGVSKMSGGIVFEAMMKVTGWAIGRRANRLRRLFGTPAL